MSVSSLTLAARLEALYEQRANLKEQLEALGRDDRMEAAAASRDHKLLVSTGMEIMGNAQKLQEEIKWVEKQILAILSNPALAGVRLPHPAYIPGA